MRHRITMVVDIDLEALAAHDQDRGPPPRDLADWHASDVFAAYDRGILEPELGTSLEEAHPIHDHEAGSPAGAEAGRHGESDSGRRSG
jgi:hypothetical protein